MRYLLLAALLLGCGDEWKEDFRGKDGRDGIAGKPGREGDTGSQGLPGKDGQQGVAGTDGVDGQDGSDGEDGTQIYPVVPCPDLAGSYPEVLMCIDDSLYAVMVGNGKNTRYVYLPPGFYQTTDGRNCNFEVAEGCNVE
jgi:hypothetical protein